jgi:23S rRNA (cytosine1962-C5)-methyltransferase
MQHPYPQIFLKPGREATLKKGHPWIFSGALASVQGQPEAGDMVLAADHAGTPLAYGFFNPRTDIAFRLLTYQTHAVPHDDFWRQRIRSAIALRRQCVPAQTSAYRLINAEGDGMPGLTADCYGGFLVVSIETAGMERRRTLILDMLQQETGCTGIYERSEGRARQREGLPDRSGPVQGDVPPEYHEVTENGILFAVDIVSGQKTGFFLDQRDNRHHMGRLSRGAAVLNCFSYTGGFSIYCIRGQAKRVISVETSGRANDIARHNLERNGCSLQSHPIVQADVFRYLRETEERFDLIILDPPAFAKAAGDVNRAARGYKDINLQAMRRLQEGGLLATFSCSNYIDETLFRKIVLAAARDAGREARLLAPLGPGPDHPVALAHIEGRYLKGLLLMVTS